MNVVDLTEWRPEPLRGEGGSRIARAVLSAGYGQLAVEAPSETGGADWTVCSKGLVGYLPLGHDVALRIAPKVPISSVLAMLDLAHDVASLEWHRGLATHGVVDGLFDTLASLLARQVANRARKGLYREYVAEQDELSAARGRILPRETLARTLRGAATLVCDFETLTDDLLDNQILLWTLDRLRRSPLGRPEVRREVRASHRLLAACLSLVPVRPVDCERSYNQLNADYRPMHALCRLLLEACGSATADGEVASIPFTISMPHLFEKYVARLLAERLQPLHVEPHRHFTLADGLSYDADLVLLDGPGGTPLAVMDTKYKLADRPEPADVQQVVFYATVLGCREACLIYPRAMAPVSFAAGPVTVRTFGLDLAALPAVDVAAMTTWAEGLRRT